MSEKNNNPAAYSEGMVWFAVDGKDEVAAFFSGEMGAVPLTGAWLSSVEDWFNTFPVNDNLCCEVDYDPSYLFRQAPTTKELSDGVLCTILPENIITVFDNFCPEFVVQFTQVENLYYFGGGEYRDSMLGMGCERYIKLDEADLLAALGVYTYVHDGEKEPEGLPPYSQVKRPSKPAKSTDFPRKTKELIKETVFDQLAFGNGRKIQPLEQTDCVTYSPVGYPWLGADGMVKGTINESESIVSKGGRLKLLLIPVVLIGGLVYFFS